MPPNQPYMIQDNRDLKPGDVRIEVPTGALTVRLYAPTVWRTFSFAPEWFADAQREADQIGHQARRREILFATCAAESYIFEWVRDTVLNHDFSALTTYFPVGLKRGVTQKFRDIPKELATAGRLSAALDCGGREFLAFHDLVEFRDGLVHASASRPETSGHPQGDGPVPSKDQLDALPPGRAVAVVRTLLAKLHRDTGTAQPDWL